ncbi:MAG: B12-binding domain-containing radical SAM protein [Deltaproteobacteria bacterium]|nr:B12-binding domain-containing radical SAM protein [Deltaproteobacteria bacterium]
MPPSLILINPWIHDFAAYDLWSKPLGLLYLARHLMHHGFSVQFIDCLDVHHPRMRHSGKARPKRRAYGTGKFWRTLIPVPETLQGTNRPYSRYGIPLEIFAQELTAAGKPAAILMTSLMTYWYPGVFEAIREAKRIYPDVPVILGGIYARLCEAHARRHSGADRVIVTSGMESLLNALENLGISPPRPDPPLKGPLYPAFDLLNQIDYVCLQTGSGCPYRCHYCASGFLNPRADRRLPGDVVAEIRYWHEAFGVRDFAFYDDALLVNSESHATVILEGLKKHGLPLRFHTPNALHVREITPPIAQLMADTGFTTIRLGLETADLTLHEQLDRKVGRGDFERAVAHLFEAGFTPRNVGAYILIGLPDQSIDSILQTLHLVEKGGAMPFLAEYSPIPHTPLWDRATAVSPYDIRAEPLFHNNTLLPCWDEEQKKALPRLKQRVMEIRRAHINFHS